MYKFALILLSALLCTACSSTTVTPINVDRSGIDIVTLPSGFSGLTVVPSSADEIVCALPGSDAVSTKASSFGVGLSQVAGGEEVKEGSEKGALALGGRNPAVLIVRELMYRLCELSANMELNAADMEKYTKLFLDTAVTMVKIQTGVGSAALTDDPGVTDLNATPTAPTITKTYTETDTTSDEQKSEDDVSDSITEEDSSSSEDDAE